MATAVAVQYAKALAGLVQEDARYDAERIAGQLKTFEAALASSTELQNVLANPAVAPQRKRAVVERLAQTAEITPLVRNFLYVLIDRRRMSLLGEVREVFEQMIDEQLGLVRARVTSAGELAEAQREKLRQELAKLVGGQVRCQYAVNPELLGGAVVQMGSTVYDGSLRGRLEALRHKLME